MSACKRMISALLLLGLGGCGTLLNLGAQPCPIYEHPRVYGATRIDLVHLLPRDFPLGLLVALLDLPFSLLVDTLTLPWTIPTAIQYGDRDTWPENTSPPKTEERRLYDLERPPGPTLVEGVVIRGDTPGYRIMPVSEIWEALPAGMQALPNVRVRAIAKAVGSDLATREGTSSDARGRFRLFSESGEPWKSIRVECDGFQSVEIPVSSLHSPTDLDYWREKRLLIRLSKP